MVPCPNREVFETYTSLHQNISVIPNKMEKRVVLPWGLTMISIVDTNVAKATILMVVKS